MLRPEAASEPTFQAGIRFSAVGACKSKALIRVVIKWWRGLNRYGPILWIPLAFAGFFGGGAALGFLAAALFGTLLHVTLDRTERLVCMIVVFLGWWAAGGIASFKADPIRAFQVQIMLGWVCIALAGVVYAATASMEL